MSNVSDQDLVLAYKCNEVIDFGLSRGESIADIDIDQTVISICTEYTSESFEEIMADHIKLMNDYPMNKAKPVSVSDDDLRVAYMTNDLIMAYGFTDSDDAVRMVCEYINNMNNLNDRLDKWVSYGKSLYADLLAVDDGSCKVNDMMDTIVNGLGFIVLDGDIDE